MKDVDMWYMILTYVPKVYVYVLRKSFFNTTLTHTDHKAIPIHITLFAINLT